MAVITSNTYLLFAKPVQFWKLFSKLQIDTNISFQVLNPQTMGGTWRDVRLFQPEQVYDDELKLLSDVLDGFSKKGWQYALIDQRPVVSGQELNDAYKKRKEILHKAQLLQSYVHIKHLEDSWKTILEKYGDIPMLIVQSDKKQFYDDTSYRVTPIFEDYYLIQPTGEEGATEGLWHLFVNDPDTQNIFDKKTLDQFIKKQLKTFTSECKKHGLNLDEISTHNLTELAALHGYYEREKKIQQMMQYVFSVEQDPHISFAFVAVQRTDAAQFEDLIQKQHIDYEKVDWETPIVNWRVPDFLQGSRSIARSLGTINVRETDPSAAILIFFSFFFALCLSDAFYGLIITLICGYFLFGTRLKNQFRPLFTLFFSSGVATIIFGALTNSWAGNLFENTPVQAVLKPFHVFEPLNPDAPVLINQFLKMNGEVNPIVAFLGLSIAVGVITLFSGYLIRLQTAIKTHDRIDALNVLSWMGLLLIIIGTIGLSVAGVSVGYVSVLLALFFASGLFIWNEGHHIATKILYGLGTLYGLIGFVADVLSFTRLVAVGLTSGIIASVVNMLGFMVYDAINLPVLNIGGAAVVLIFGHVFNLIISLFGAYVNPLRLHYVEFMPKFYKGQAKQIQPADSRNYSYLQIS